MAQRKEYYNNKMSACWRFPFPAQVRQKPGTCAAFLVQLFVAPIAVVPDGRDTHENLGRIKEAREGLREKPGSHDSAFTDVAFPFLRPSAGCNAFAGQMDYRVHPFQGMRIQDSLGRIPADLTRTGFRTSDQSNGAMVVFRQKGTES